MTHPGLRASDDDRRRVVTELERHTADGRLSLEEFSERVRLAHSATTHGDLQRLTQDLPVPDPGTAALERDHRQLIIAMILALVTISLLAIALAVTR